LERVGFTPTRGPGLERAGFTPTRGPGRRIGTALAATLAMTACGNDDPHVRYRMVGLARATADGCAPADDARPMIAGATRARLTFRDETAAGPGPFRCDVVLPLDGRVPLVAVPRRNVRAAMWVEYFDDAGNLLARGAEREVDLDSGETVRIEVGAAGDYGCAVRQPARPRAFHSATLLPDGNVLLLGGLAGSLADGAASFAPDDGAHALATAELYDPIKGTGLAVTIPGLAHRAFHQTVVVGQDADTVRLLVIGGHGVNADATSPGNVAAIPGGSGAPPWIPPGVDLGRGRFGARALPVELLTYRVATRSFTRTEVASMGPEARTEAAVSPTSTAAKAVAFIGGRTAGGGARATNEAVRADGTVSGTTSGRLRVGATVTLLPAGDAIVLGGDVGTDLGSVRAADHLSGLDGSPAIDTGPSDTSAQNRAYHAAAVLGTDQVVAYGGLRLGGGGVEDRGPDSLIGRVSAGSLSLSTIDPGGAPAVAYPDAVTLHDGSVLGAGGARPAGACSRAIVCPSPSSVRIETDGSPARPAGALGLPRYGHRLVRLPDGTVLVTGGLVSDPADATRLRATAAVEQFEAHRAADDPLADLAITRAAGDVARDEQGQPIAECVRIGGDSPGPDAAPDAAIDAP
jgi:hypothetical protein